MKTLSDDKYKIVLPAQWVFTLSAHILETTMLNRREMCFKLKGTPVKQSKLNKLGTIKIRVTHEPYVFSGYFLTEVRQCSYRCSHCSGFILKSKNQLIRKYSS